MPQPSRSTTTSKRPGRNGNIPVGDVSEAEAAAIRASVARKEQAPSSRQQTFVDWRKLADQLGQPFEVERIPISKLRSMARDPMLAFGLAFIETPHARAEWGVNAQDSNGPNHQVAGNVDYALRRIWVSFVSQFFLSLRFGSVALAKRFEERVPSGTYIDTNPDTGERQELPLWSEGGIAPILWKPFVALPPETVEPVWNSDGEFDGIDYTPPEGGGGAPAGTGSSSNGKEGYKIPLSHSLWITNERETVFGNMYGYPRLGYAYRYWWSYWFRWAIADRAFERKGDPSIIVKHPEGDVYDPLTQSRREAADVAMEIGERMRSGGVITMPSDVYMGEVNGTPSAQPQWDIDTLKDMLDFDPFDASFEYLDIMKLRSLWVPEQAFLEGKGGTSSRNVASEMGDAFMEQQELLSNLLVEHVNRWVIPQFLAINFPEFVAAGGTAKMVMKGFSPRDMQAMREGITLIAQQERGARELASIVDVRQMADALGMPTRPFAEQVRVEGELKAEAAAAAQPSAPAAPAGSGLGVVPTATGFAYTNQPDRERLVLFSADAGKFEDGLREIDSPAFDRATRSMARELWGVFNVTYRDEYDGFAEWISGMDLSAVEMAQPGDSHWNRAKKLINDWNRRANALAAITKAKKVISRVTDYAIEEGTRRIGGEKPVPSEIRNAAVDKQIADSVTQIFSTTEDELTRFLANQLEAGVTDGTEIAKAARQHFAEFPVWKSDRASRNEVRNAYNEGILLATDTNSADVQALDAMLGDTDEDCKLRDGRIYSPTEARQQSEHPYGTLTFRALPAGFSVVYLEDAETPRARYDAESMTVYFEGGVSDATQRSYLKAVVDKLYE